MTLSYLFDWFINEGIYEWTVRDTPTVHAMLNAKCGEKFESDTFEIARLKWKLEIYPNGDSLETNGYFIIHLRLLSLPPLIDQIQICRTFRVKESMAGSTWIAVLSEEEYEFWGKKCPLKELKDIPPDTITVSVHLRVNKITLNNDMKFERDYLSNSVKETYPKHQRLEHKLVGPELEMFKS